MRVNELTDERVAQYLCLYSCLFQTTVERLSKSPNNDSTNARETRSKTRSRESLRDDEKLLTPAEMKIHEAGLSENHEFECYFCPEVFSDELTCLKHQRTHNAGDS